LPAVLAIGTVQNLESRSQSEEFDFHFAESAQSDLSFEFKLGSILLDWIECNESMNWIVQGAIHRAPITSSMKLKAMINQKFNYIE
jgi:hypothetical protein